MAALLRPSFATTNFWQRTRPAFSTFLLALLFKSWLVLPLGATDVPSTSYIFPAGARRGTTVSVRIGAHYLHGGGPMRVIGDGIHASPRVDEIERIWFEGPLIVKPASQRNENYPKDHAATFRIDADAPLGVHFWQLWTAQGAIQGPPFVVGELPEHVENEIDGTPVPVLVELPITINGRIFPREDVDLWRFRADAGDAITCEVNSARLGYPLDSRLELRGPDGRRAAENDDYMSADSRLRFTAPVSGLYELRISDAEFGGLQNYVYRLTLTKGPTVDHIYPLGGPHGTHQKFLITGSMGIDVPLLQPVSEAIGIHRFPFRIESHPTNEVIIQSSAGTEYVESPDNSNEVTVAAEQRFFLNGRILRPGEVDRWRIQGSPNQPLNVRVWAQSLGSQLDARIRVIDGEQTLLEETGSTINSRLEPRVDFRLSEHGRAELEIKHVDEVGAGVAYGYRIELTASSPADYSLVLPSDALTIYRGESSSMKIQVERVGLFDREVQLLVDHLPPGVTYEPMTVAGDATEGVLTFHATDDARIQGVPIIVRGHARHAESDSVESDTPAGKNTQSQEHCLIRTAEVRRRPGETVRNDVLMAVCLRTPFKFRGDRYRIEYASRGSIYRRPYLLDRGDYEGELAVSLADVQVRHLQGVTGPTLKLGADASEFEYPLRIPLWLEQNRTGRVVLMAVGEIVDEEGRSHKVSYSSPDVKDQMILLTSPARTALSASPKYIDPAHGATTFSLSFARGQVRPAPVRVELVTPPHMDGFHAEPVTLAAENESGAITVRVRQPQGPFNMPLALRATTHDANGDPVVSEQLIEIVSAP